MEARSQLRHRPTQCGDAAKKEITNLFILPQLLEIVKPKLRNELRECVKT